MGGIVRSVVGTITGASDAARAAQGAANVAAQGQQAELDFLRQQAQLPNAVLQGLAGLVGYQQGQASQVDIDQLAQLKQQLGGMQQYTTEVVDRDGRELERNTINPQYASTQQQIADLEAKIKAAQTGYTQTGAPFAGLTGLYNQAFQAAQTDPETQRLIQKSITEANRQFTVPGSVGLRSSDAAIARSAIAPELQSQFARDLQQRYFGLLGGIASSGPTSQQIGAAISAPYQTRAQGQLGAAQAWQQGYGSLAGLGGQLAGQFMTGGMGGLGGTPSIGYNFGGGR